MARPLKIGIDYFSHDTNMSKDSKIRFIKAKYGIIGYAVYSMLLEDIYSENGYFIKAGEKFSILFAAENNIDINVFNNLINDYINEELFDRDVFEKYKVLTSKRIQKNFLVACERRKTVDFISEYLLIDPEEEKTPKTKVSVNIISINVNNNSINVNKSTQKEKEKEKENEKEKEIIIYDNMNTETLKNESGGIIAQEVVNLWNELCPSFPKVLMLSLTRKERIDLLYRQVKDIELFKQAFKKIEESSFCKGRNNKKWVASFDWILIEDTNIIKVLEGKYDGEHDGEPEQNKTVDEPDPLFGGG